RDQSKLDWIASGGENNRNRSGRGLCHEVSRSTGRSNDRDSTPNKVVNQCSQTVVLAVRPAIFDGDILAIDITAFPQPFEKGLHLWRITLGRPHIDKPNHPHRLLLGTRHERPCGHSATNHFDEITPSHGRPAA